MKYKEKYTLTRLEMPNDSNAYNFLFVHWSLTMISNFYHFKSVMN